MADFDPGHVIECHQHHKYIYDERPYCPYCKIEADFHDYASFRRDHAALRAEYAKVTDTLAECQIKLSATKPGAVGDLKGQGSGDFPIFDNSREGLLNSAIDYIHGLLGTINISTRSIIKATPRLDQKVTSRLAAYARVQIILDRYKVKISESESHFLDNGYLDPHWMPNDQWLLNIAAECINVYVDLKEGG